MSDNSRPDLLCAGCGNWQEEGTLNRETGHYIKAGMPSSPRGWVAP